MKSNKKTIYSALTVVTALLAQLPATAQETADSAMVNVAFKKAQKSDVLGRKCDDNASGKASCAGCYPC